jgi:hypothetical protein
MVTYRRCGLVLATACRRWQVLVVVAVLTSLAMVESERIEPAQPEPLECLGVDSCRPVDGELTAAGVRSGSGAGSRGGSARGDDSPLVFSRAGDAISVPPLGVKIRPRGKPRIIGAGLDRLGYLIAIDPAKDADRVGKAKRHNSSQNCRKYAPL